VNRRSFLGLGLKSIVVATALTTGLGRTTLALVKDEPVYEWRELSASVYVSKDDLTQNGNHQLLIDLMDKKIEQARKGLQQPIDKTLDEIWSKPSVVMPDGRGLLA
jgi:hypothetical protein